MYIYIYIYIYILGHEGFLSTRRQSSFQAGQLSSCWGMVIQPARQTLSTAARKVSSLSSPSVDVPLCTHLCSKRRGAQRTTVGY